MYDEVSLHFLTYPSRLECGGAAVPPCSLCQALFLPKPVPTFCNWEDVSCHLITAYNSGTIMSTNEQHQEIDSRLDRLSTNMC
jgi:hypothetical protein